jgi:hypothetical protein
MVPSRLRSWSVIKWFVMIMKFLRVAKATALIAKMPAGAQPPLPGGKWSLRWRRP